MLTRVPWTTRILDVRKVTNRYYKLRRYVATSFVDLMPRGSTKHASKEPKSEREEEVQHMVEDDAISNSENVVKGTNIKPKGDTRPLDKIDPVILKYTNILNDLRTAENTPEKVYETHFGSIRFDTENIPKVHGQYERIEYLDSEQYPSEYNVKDPMMAPSGDKEPVASLAGIAESAEVIHTPENGRQGKQSQNNYFDELFFGEGSNGSEAAIVEEKSTATMSPKIQTQVKDMNFIDKQYFKDAVESYETHKLFPKNSKTDLHMDRIHEQELPTVETNSLNYIDDIFFKESLDNINTSNESRTESKYTVIESEILKTLKTKPGPEFGEAVLRNQEVRLDTVRIEDPLLIQKQSVRDVKQTNLGRKSVETKNDVEQNPKTAFDFVINMRKEEREKSFDIGREGEKKNYKKVLALVDEKHNYKYTKNDILGLLKKSVIYDKYDIVALYKPYGVTMHGQSGENHILTDFLPDLARHLGTDQLHIVHRLDVNTTGVLLLARTPAMASTLKHLFKERKVKKTYWGITRGIPKPLHGVIDIPVGEGSIGKRRRMVLLPDVEGMKVPSGHRQRAITEFRVLSKANSSSLVELSPVTGVKHQLRVHLGFGLGCPILGDHKYSNLDKMAPQRLPGDMLTCMKMKQSRVRDLPIFLHSRSILLPEFVDGRNIYIKAKLPSFFNKTLSLLKLNKRKNQVQDVDLDSSD